MAKEKKDGSAENSGENKEQRKRGRVENIIAYQFKPGESGNPGGRPRKVLSDAYTALMDQKFPGDAKGRTYAQLIAEGQAKQAIKGKTDAAHEIGDRVEGKVRQSIELSGPDGSPVRVASYRAKLEEVFGIPIARHKKRKQKVDTAKRQKPRGADTGTARGKTQAVS